MTSKRLPDYEAWAVTTIEGHISHYVSTGEIDILKSYFGRKTK